MELRNVKEIIDLIVTRCLNNLEFGSYKPPVGELNSRRFRNLRDLQCEFERLTKRNSHVLPMERNI